MTVFILPGSNEAIAIQIVLSFIFVKVHGTKKPYLEWEEDFLGEMRTWVTLLSLQVTLLFSLEIFDPYGPFGFIFVGLIGMLGFAAASLILYVMKDAFFALYKSVMDQAVSLFMMLGMKKTENVQAIAVEAEASTEVTATPLKPVEVTATPLRPVTYEVCQEDKGVEEHKVNTAEKDERKQYLLSKFKGPMFENLPKIDPMLPTLPSSKLFPSDHQTPTKLSGIKTISSQLELASKYKELPGTIEVGELDSHRLKSIHESVDKLESRLLELSLMRSQMRHRLVSDMELDPQYVENIESGIFAVSEGVKEIREQKYEQLRKTCIEYSFAKEKLMLIASTGVVHIDEFLLQIRDDRRLADVMGFREKFRQALYEGAFAGNSKEIVSRIEKVLFLKAQGDENIEKTFVDFFNTNGAASRSLKVTLKEKNAQLEEEVTKLLDIWEQ